MRQLIHALRSVSLAFVVAATFVTLTPSEPAAARYSKADLEYVCVSQGGIYWETEASITGVTTYGCWYPEGDEDTCYQFADVPDPICTYDPAPEDNVGDLPPGSSYPVDDQIADEAGPIGPAPVGPNPATGSSRSGFETKMASQ